MKEAPDSLQLTYRLFVATALALVVILASLVHPGLYSQAWKEVESLQKLADPDFVKRQNTEERDFYIRYFELIKQKERRSDLTDIEHAITDKTQVVFDNQELLVLDYYECATHNECGTLKSYEKYIHSATGALIPFLEILSLDEFEKTVENAIQRSNLVKVHAMTFRADPKGQTCHADIVGSVAEHAPCDSGDDRDSGLHPNSPPSITRVRRLFAPLLERVVCGFGFIFIPVFPAALHSLRATEKLSGFGSEVSAPCIAPASICFAGQAVRAMAALP